MYNNNNLSERPFPSCCGRPSNPNQLRVTREKRQQLQPYFCRWLVTSSDLVIIIFFNYLIFSIILRSGTIKKNK